MPGAPSNSIEKLNFVRVSCFWLSVDCTKFCTKFFPLQGFCTEFLLRNLMSGHLLPSKFNVAGVYNLVSVNHRPRLVAGDQHGLFLAEAIGEHVGDGRPPQVVNERVRYSGANPG